jgi:hypothetical protein
MQELAHPRPVAARTSHAGKTRKQSGMMNRESPKREAASPSSSAIWTMISARSYDILRKSAQAVAPVDYGLLFTQRALETGFGVSNALADSAESRFILDFYLASRFLELRFLSLCHRVMPTGIYGTQQYESPAKTNISQKKKGAIP